MDPESIPNPEQEKPKAWIVYGGPGHAEEYVISLEDYGMDNFIPQRIVTEIERRLGDDWEVSNRGSRIEVLGEEDPEVEGVVSEVLSEEYEIVIE